MDAWRRNEESFILKDGFMIWNTSQGTFLEFLASFSNQRVFVLKRIAALSRDGSTTLDEGQFLEDNRMLLYRYFLTLSSRT